MAQADVVIDLSQKANNAFLDIQPPSNTEYVIHNIHHEGAAELYFSDGTNQVLVASDTNQGSWLGLFLHCTNSKYYRIKNTAGSNKYLGYDGVQSK